ncbi:MAG: indolepyruvate oxidoreductase subunit beta [Spirochaetales bacterium]|nr:indolepyruvate oxidoreductase subunit beta [Spirochaetales bacterium]
MKYDIILCGVGGQGVLSVGAIIAQSAMKAGFQVKQSEVHGMAQRGGAVLANLRISEKEIASDLIAAATASMILSMEPLESLRYIGYLAPDGILVTSKNPVENISNYPDTGGVLAQIEKLPAYRIVDSDALAREAGSMLATNMVMVGAASSSLPIDEKIIEAAIVELFAAKGDHVIDVNLEAFRLGKVV